MIFFNTLFQNLHSARKPEITLEMIAFNPNLTQSCFPTVWCTQVITSNFPLGIKSPLPGLADTQVCGGIDSDSSLPAQWAMVFADAAANTALLDHVRALERDGVAVSP